METYHTKYLYNQQDHKGQLLIFDIVSTKITDKCVFFGFDG